MSRAAENLHEDGMESLVLEVVTHILNPCCSTVKVRAKHERKQRQAKDSNQVQTVGNLNLCRNFIQGLFGVLVLRSLDSIFIFD